MTSATAKVAYITAMIIHLFIVSSAVQIYLLGVIHFIAVHQGTPWTGGQCFVHHPTQEHYSSVVSFQVCRYFMLINIDIIFDHVACFVLGKRACKRVKSFACGKISNMDKIINATRKSTSKSVIWQSLKMKSCMEVKLPLIKIHIHY